MCTLRVYTKLSIFENIFLEIKKIVNTFLISKKFFSKMINYCVRAHIKKIYIYIYIYIYTLRCDKRSWTYFRRDGPKGQLSAQFQPKKKKKIPAQFGCLRNCARIDGIGEKNKKL